MNALTPEQLVLAALIVPLVGAALIPLFHRYPNLRETVTLVTAALLAIIVWSLLGPVLAGERPEALNLHIAVGLSLAFKVEPIGLMFALVASTLWIVNSIYSIGYMRGNKEPRQTTFYVCFAVAIASTMGIAFAGNLFTLFLFYEALTLSTYPLVTHKANLEAKNAGRVYLLLLLGTSMLLLLPAIIITAVVAGTLDFTAGGILAGKVSPIEMGVLLALYALGIGKAALIPIHFWLPAAMVAPTPVSALLHAVAVVKAGVFTVLKVVVYVFGIDALSTSGMNEWLIWLACFTIIAASLVALRQDNLKKRLAYSTVSQLSYVVLGAALATTVSVAGGALHIVMHAAGKITLFFCAGAIYTAAHKTEVSELDGIGRTMPFTMAAFAIGSLSLIGLPPLGGIWSKLLLGIGALDANLQFALVVLMISSLLNVAYLMPIVARAFFLPVKSSSDHGHGTPDEDGLDDPAQQHTSVANRGRWAIKEAPLPCVVALCFTALLCIVLFFYAGQVQSLILPALSAK